MTHATTAAIAVAHCLRRLLRPSFDRLVTAPGRAAARAESKNARRPSEGVVHAVAIGCLLQMGWSGAAAQEFPERSVTIIVPFAAGGPFDSTARVLAEGLAKQLGKPVIVENRPGASGIVGATAAFTSQADGYRVLYAAASAANSTFVPGMSFDFLERFDPVGRVSSATFCLYSSKAVPASNLAEFVQYAKANPGKLNYGSQTVSTGLIAELFKSKAGIDLAPIPYGGSAPALAAILAGDIQAVVDNPGAGGTRSNAEAGNIKALACSDAEQNPYAPSVPTFKQSGYPDIVFSLSSGIWVVKGVDPARRKKLDDAIFRVVSDPEIAKRFFDAAAPANPGGAEQLLATTIAERDLLLEAARISNFKPAQ